MARLQPILFDLGSNWDRLGVDLGSIWRPNGRSNEKGPTCDPSTQAHTDCVSTPPRATRKSIKSRSGRRRGSHVRSKTSSECHGASREAFRDASGTPQGVPPASGAPPERFGASGGHLGVSWISPWAPWRPPERLGVDLGSIWARFGVDLDRFWFDLARFCAGFCCPLADHSKSFFFRPSSRLRRPCNDLSAASVPQ